MIKIIRVVLSLIGAIIALIIAHQFNIFEHMDFIPGDKAYDVCVTVYFTIVESLINIIWESITAQIKEKQTEVKVVLFNDKNNVSPGCNPIVRFNDMDVAKVFARVYISGNVKNLNDKKVMIYAMSQMDYQIGNKGSALSLDKDGNIAIDLKKMCGNQDKVQLSEDFSFMLQRSVRGENTTVICPELQKGSFVKYICNNATIMMGGKI
ncbi:hypothetical protein [Butyrivibrio sp. AE2005]|uniref:hypothetical protein n=1 Tax=Butyrivibrio sp. AE2005 TaxID=1496722 RepID=UPI00047A0B74|nr:hypothetical protein [Butyrivibrio sp. AE2005]